MPQGLLDVPKGTVPILGTAAPPSTTGPLPQLQLHRTV
jgi:hypothetical protein